MTKPELFLSSQAALLAVVRKIHKAQWAEEVPPAITQRQPTPNLREIVNYHAYDDAWVPDTLAGKTATDVGDKYDGDLLGDDPLGNFTHISHQASEAVERLRNEDLEKVVHLSYGDFAAGVYLVHIAIFRGFRAYDIAKYIGIEARLPNDLVSGLWGELEPQAEALRAIGVFGPLVDVPDDAPLHDRLLGLSGRDLGI